LEYSRGYEARVCVDISKIALQEARKRIGNHGLFAVCDIANLPFKPGVFDGAVSLHTIHHLPEDQHLQAYQEIHRVLAPQGQAAIVNGWPSSRLMNAFEPGIRLLQRIQNRLRKLRGEPPANKTGKKRKEGAPKGTFTNRHDVAWIKEQVGGRLQVEIWVWRTPSVRFLRALIHPWNGGRLWLRILFALEERFPHFFGENGQYPLIVIRK
jgi:SAM-dependent methyltransferase